MSTSKPTYFRAKQRIKRHQDFRRARQGQHYRCSGMILNRIQSQTDASILLPDSSRLGIIVSKKVIRKAHKRNRQKRIIREAFRLQQHDIPKGEDWVIIITRFTDENHLRSQLQQLFDVSKK